jgi:hypothetical protein
MIRPASPNPPPPTARILPAQTAEYKENRCDFPATDQDAVSPQHKTSAVKTR